MIAESGLGRLYRGQTAVDFYGHRRVGLIAAIVIVVVTVGSLLFQGLNLGLAFEGGQAWDVPAGETFDVDDAEQVLRDNDVSVAGSTIQLRESADRSVISIQIEVVEVDVAAAITEDFAAASGSEVSDLNFEFTSSSWGSEITEKALRALVIFLIIVAIFISIRFEWRMAVAALAAMSHDVLFAVGVYTVFQFEVTPATVIAFLTILGYSLYDTIVVFDRVQENEGKYAGVRMPYPDVVNISMNQVLMRSINTSISSILPVASLLLIGSGFLGAVALREFALALLVGMIAGVYSSIFVASPLLATLRSNVGRAARRERLTGEDLRAAVIGAGVTGRVVKDDDDGDADPIAVQPDAVHQPAERLLSHPPRPRKKKKR
ncbi:MAG: preprotein translocase subunit SecF [Ilumatobacter sp.]|jgi:preprotein translocase subunit SecF